MGNFVLMSPPASARPNLESANYEGLIVRATVARRAVRALEVLPISMDARGDPRFASQERGGRMMGKLCGLSASLGLDIPLNGWFGNVTLA
jgi:hypothetical protein